MTQKEQLRGWYFCRDDRRLRYEDGRLVAPGVTHKVDPKGLRLCTHGLHGSASVLNALDYAPGPILAEVTFGGAIIKGTDKVCASERTYIRVLDATPVLREFSRWCALQVIHLWAAPPVVKQYLETGDESLLGAAWDAAGAAARDAEMAAARDAEMAAARAAARVTSGVTAGAAARDAARDAEMAAARAAAKAAARAAAKAAGGSASSGVSAWVNARAAERVTARGTARAAGGSASSGVSAWVNARAAERVTARGTARAAGVTAGPTTGNSAWDAAWDAQEAHLLALLEASPDWEYPE